MTDAAEHRMPVRVYYEDTDAGGVVYHTAYLRFMERARTEWLRALGLTHEAAAQADRPVLFAVRRIEADYLRPARLDDALEVVTVPEPSPGARLNMEQRVERDGAVLVRARVQIVCITPEGRPARPPQTLVKSIAPERAGVLKST